MGRALDNALLNLGLKQQYKQGVDKLGFNMEDLLAQERDTSLGNGGLGRLAAHYLDSSATQELPVPSTSGSKIIFGDSETLAGYDEDIKICASNIPPPARPPAPINPWASLTIDEMVEIQNWLLSTPMNLNLM
ncbi:hypothetical protein EV424DRAFT_1580777 [Suillus variegatus]|nr:hypothetical protein EV424DRAFT_1580777 [Suillus variegatus]